MMHNYFPTYEVEEPQSHAVFSLGRGSYVAAGALGCFYVLLRGFVGRFFLALAIDVVLVAGAAVVAVALVNFLPAANAVIAMIMVAIGLGVVRSVPIIAIVKNGYRQRGWMVSRV
jgi:hypothetical protein